MKLGSNTDNRLQSFISNHDKLLDVQHQNILKRSSIKVNPLRNASTIDFKGAPNSGKHPISIKNVSTVGQLWNDYTKPSAESPKQKCIYRNKYFKILLRIFQQKKEFEVPRLMVKEDIYKTIDPYKSLMNEKNRFVKPYQFSKQVDQLANGKILNRETTIPSITNKAKLTSSQSMSNRQYSIIGRPKKIKLFQQPASYNREMRRASCQNSLDKHYKIFEHYLNSDIPQRENAFNNALNHLVDSDNIFQLLKRSRKSTQTCK